MRRHFEDHNAQQQQGPLMQPRNSPEKMKTFHVRLISYGRRDGSVVSARDSSGLGSSPLWRVIREFKITTTVTAKGTSLNKRFNEQNNGPARAL